MLHLQVLDLTHVVPVLECLFWFVGLLVDSRPEPRVWSIRPVFTQWVSCLLSPLIPFSMEGPHLPHCGAFAWLSGASNGCAPSV